MNIIFITISGIIIITNYIAYEYLFIIILPFIFLLYNRNKNILFLVIIGFSIAALRLGYHYTKIIYPKVPQKLVLNGYIASLPRYHYHALRFIFVTDSIAYKNMAICLSWYGWPPTLYAGQKWQLYVKLNKYYDHYLFGCCINGYVVQANNYLGHSFKLKYSLLYIRQKIAETIYHAVHAHDLAAILIALTIGSHYTLQKQDFAVFQNTGTSHLIAISGLHISLVMVFSYFMCKFLLSRICCIFRIYNIHQLFTILAFIGAVIYAALSGFAAPTARALLMTFVVCLGNFLSRNIFLWNRLLWALAIILLFSPDALFSISLWLSFFAVGMLVFISKTQINIHRRIVTIIYQQSKLFILLAPLTLFIFSHLSLIMVVTNLIAIPYISFIVVPICLLATLLYLVAPVLSGFCWKYAAGLLQPLWLFLKYCAAEPRLIWHHDVTSFGAFISGVISGLLMLAPYGIPCRRLWIFFALPFFLCS